MKEFPFVAIGYLVVLDVPPVEKTKGGIHLPDGAKNKEDASGEMGTATVLAAGAQCRYVRAGDEVYWKGRNLPVYLVNGRKVAIGTEHDNVVGIKKRGDGGPFFRVADWQAGKVDRDSITAREVAEMVEEVRDNLTQFGCEHCGDPGHPTDECAAMPRHKR